MADGSRVTSQSRRNLLKSSRTVQLIRRALVNAINGEGTIVMNQGSLGHTGAQGRAKGFHSVVSKFPKVQVLDDTARRLGRD
jgi:hypothetical protein